MNQHNLVINCPYCKHSHDVNEYCLFGDNDEFDVVCKNCGKEFEIVRYWTLTHNTFVIEYETCVFYAKKM